MLVYNLETILLTILWAPKKWAHEYYLAPILIVAYELSFRSLDHGGPAFWKACCIKPIAQMRLFFFWSFDMRLSMVLLAWKLGIVY